MTGDDFAKALAVARAWVDGSDSLQTMMGVLFTFKNRADNNGGDWLKTIGYFPPEIPLTAFDVRHPEFVKLLQIVDGVFDGTRPDITDGSTVYTSSAYRPPTVVIGKLFFYREV